MLVVTRYLAGNAYFYAAEEVRKQITGNLIIDLDDGCFISLNPESKYEWKEVEKD